MAQQQAVRRAVTASSSQLSGVAAAVRRALFGVGVVATGRSLIRRLRRDEPELQRPRPNRPQSSPPFDTDLGVVTDGFLSWRQLQSGRANDPYISGYLAIAPSVGRRVIGLIEAPERYVFVDLGCGRGRAVIIASEFPFRRVIGVEISAELAATARENAAVVASRYKQRSAIEVVHADAAHFELPEGPLVLFLYQPFEKPVLRRVLNRLAASLEAAPRPAALIYVHPMLAGTVDRCRILERVAAGSYTLAEEEVPYSYGGRGGADGFVIWRARGSGVSIRPNG